MLSLYLCSFVRVFVFRCILLVADVYPPSDVMLAQRVCDWPHTLRTLSSLTDPTRTLSSLTSYKITSLTSQQHTFILPELVYAPVHFMFAKFWSFVAVLLGFFRLFHWCRNGSVLFQSLFSANLLRKCHRVLQCDLILLLCWWQKTLT